MNIVKEYARSTPLHVNAGFCGKFPLLCLLAFAPPVVIPALAGEGEESALSPWKEHPGYRMRPLQVASEGKPGFTLVEPRISGVLFTNVLSEAELAKDSTLLSGSGVALGDVDGDGLCDIYFCSLAGENKLFRNLGHWKFENITSRARVACAGQVSRGAVLADLNGDGALDLLVTAKAGGTRLFFNDGKGVFTEATAQSGLATNTGSTSLALADVDGNGTLDLYVANFGSEMVLRQGGRVYTRMMNGKPVVVGRHAKKLRLLNGQLIELGEPDVLYLNDGSGHFKAMSWGDGSFLDEKGNAAETPWDFGLAVQMRDLNGDGWPDIYVCNDFYTPDRIWLNNGRGQFRAIDSQAMRKSSFAAMGVDFADIDRDGHMDGFVIEMLALDPQMRLQQKNADLAAIQQPGLTSTDRPQAARNTFYWNRGDGTYAEIAWYAGLAASDWSWSPVFLDVDLDGFEDLLIANGPTYDLLNLDAIAAHQGRDARLAPPGRMDFPRLEVPNRAFRNRGNRTFVECGSLWGFDSLNACTGMALADLDGDGDLDVVVNCLGGNALLYRNQSSQPRVAVRLNGTPPNTQGIGGLIVVRGGAVPFQSQEIVSGGRYLSGDDPVRVFAAGAMTNRMTIEVSWRSGKRSVLTGVLPNFEYEVDEAGALTPTPLAIREKLRLWFEDRSEALGHKHHQEPCEDTDRQPLLPWRLSRLGPAVAWWDVDGDGREDLVIGGGRNTQPEVYRWMAQGRFEKALLRGPSNHESAAANIPPLWLLAGSASGQPELRLEPALTNFGETCPGPVAVGDPLGNGQLVAFIGGRMVPGRYPEPASSFILRNTGNDWRVDTELSTAFKNLGLVTGAVFSDLDGDGRAELVLACEWGPLRVFRQQEGKWIELTDRLGLDRYTGLWQSVTTGDFDGDGRMDIIAGNWGLNSEYQASEQRPLVLYYGDFNEDGSVQILETQYDLNQAKLLSLRGWDEVTGAMPFLARRFPTHKSFSEAGIQEILGERFTRARKLEAAVLAPMLFLNRGTCFEPRPLPPEAAWTPVFGISVADFDGDGFEDLLLAQNFFGTRTEAARQDAGRGLLLKGDGTGHFVAVPGQESGVLIDGEQCGCAIGDYDGDGRVDAVICQNGEDTRLLHNLAATPGLRVTLKGPPSNPEGIGATVRLGTGEQWGPAREIHGSGYCSQDSPRPTLAAAGRDHVMVRWPGGKVCTAILPPMAREVVIGWTGEVRKVR